MLYIKKLEGVGKEENGRMELWEKVWVKNFALAEWKMLEDGKRKKQVRVDIFLNDGKDARKTNTYWKNKNRRLLHFLNRKEISVLHRKDFAQFCVEILVT